MQAQSGACLPRQEGLSLLFRILTNDGNDLRRRGVGVRECDGLEEVCVVVCV